MYLHDVVPGLSLSWTFEAHAIERNPTHGIHGVCQTCIDFPQALEWEAQLHCKHDEKFQQEFGKYSRLAGVLRSQPVLDAVSKIPRRNASVQSNMNRRDIPDLLKLMLCVDKATNT